MTVEPIDTPTCSNCGTEWPGVELDECLECHFDDFGDCCIRPEDHDCEASR